MGQPVPASVRFSEVSLYCDYRFKIVNRFCYCYCYRLGLCPDWQDWKSNNALQNASEAMGLADNWLDVKQVIITPSRSISFFLIRFFFFWHLILSIITVYEMATARIKIIKVFQLSQIQNSKFKKMSF